MKKIIQSNQTEFLISNWKDIMPNLIKGLYYLYIGDEIVYIGKATNIRNRLMKHFREKEDGYINYDKITKIKIDYNNYDNELEEIEKHKPRWNNTFNLTNFDYDEINCRFCNKRHAKKDKCIEQIKFIEEVRNKMKNEVFEK